MKNQKKNTEERRESVCGEKLRANKEPETFYAF